MTTPERTAPREFWLCGEPNEHDVGIWYDHHPGVDVVYGKEFHRYHVIEKSAYDQLKTYRDAIYDYVQCTGNTSPKTLGYHVAEALVMDHKDLKAKLAECGGKDWQNLASQNILLKRERDELLKWQEQTKHVGAMNGALLKELDALAAKYEELLSYQP